MRSWAALICLALPTVARAADPEPAAAEKLAADARKAWDVPGLAVVVVRGDDTLLLKGFGVRELSKPAPVTPDTVFPLASCSKAFTTTLLAMLADDGAIGWDDPLRKHLPTFKLSDPNADALLTVRDLLCHRCGIAGHDLLWYRAPWGIDETLKRAQSLPLDYPFRGGFKYSSIPFLAAGRAIEKRTGEKWEKLVRTRVCDPLGMTGVTFTTTDIPKDADRASGHRLGKTGKVEPEPWYEMREPNPSGSVNATARDLAAWLKFHLAEGVGPDGKRIVSIKNLTETHTPQNIIRMEGSAKVLNPDTTQLSYAMGWLVYDHRGKKVLSHGGLIDGFRVQITMLPDENLGFAVLANLHDTRMNAALTNSLIDLYCGLPPKDWNAYYRKVVDDEAAAKKAATDARNKARDPDAKPSLALSLYAGEYTHPAYGTATVTVTNGKLVLAWGNFTCPLEHFERDTFRVTGGFFEDQLVPFTVTDGKATGLRALTGVEFIRK
jgi:CubicO group peptidase (beta-lactamase class C family)